MEGKKLISIKVSTILIIAVIIILILIGVLLFLQHTNSNKGDNRDKTTNILATNTQNDENTTNTNSSTNSISDSVDNSSIVSNRYEEIRNDLDGIDVLFVTDALDNGDDTYTLQGVIYTQYTLSQSELDEIILEKQLEVNDTFLNLQESDGNYFLIDNTGTVTYNIVRNGDDSYYLESPSQISDVWKLTDKYMEITVSADTPCSVLYDDTSTVSEHFSNYTSDLPTDTTNPNYQNCYTFHFENDNCTEVVNALTSI